MKKMILLLLVLTMAGCASRNKHKSSSELKQKEETTAAATLQLNQNNVAAATQQSTESSAAQSTASDVSVSNEAEIAGEYIGRADSTGVYPPARFTHVQDGDTIVDITMSGPGNFKFKNSGKENSSKKAEQHAVQKESAAESHAEASGSATLNAESGFTKNLQVEAEEEGKTVRTSGFNWSLLWLLVIPAVLFGRWWLTKWKRQ